MNHLRNQLLNLLISGTFAAAVSGATVTTSSLDGGGSKVASANYSMDGSVGGIEGISSAASDVAKNGYIGQLTDVISVSVTGTPSSVNETATSQLTGVVIMDDASLTLLTGPTVTWAFPTFPIASIDANGLATMSAVYQNTPATFSGSYLGVLGVGSLLVIDSIPDNYGSYAGDGIPDSWQAQYFGLNNPNAAPGIDADGTGQNNLFKYIAGLDPTNPASIFTLNIASVAGQPAQKNLIFNPVATGRTYTIEFSTNLVGASYAALASVGGPQTNGSQVTVTDLSAAQPVKFYHVNISLP